MSRFFVRQGQQRLAEVGLHVCTGTGPFRWQAPSVAFLRRLGAAGVVPRGQHPQSLHGIAVVCLREGATGLFEGWLRLGGLGRDQFRYRVYLEPPPH